MDSSTPLASRALDAVAVRRHIEAKFAAAPLEHYPFPHLIIERFFPDEVYERILAFNLFRENRGVEWLTPGKGGPQSSTPYDLRKQINFHAAQPYAASDEARAFWTALSALFLGDDWFSKVVQAKFPDYFAIRFGEALKWPDLWRRLQRELFVQRHDPGYRLGPHTDIPTRVFTCIFSFAERAGFEEYGTQLMRPADPAARCWGRRHYGFEGFERAKLAPYSPNFFFLFFKTRQSFHAVKTITPDVPAERYGMQYQCWEPGGGLFRDLSHPKLLAAGLQADAGV